MYEEVVELREVQDVEALRSQLAAAEKRCAEIENNHQRKDSECSENGPPPSRVSISAEEMQLTLPLQEDTNMRDDVSLESPESPKMRKAASENLSSLAPRSPVHHRTRKIVIANESSYLETPLLKAGTLYRNSEIELSAKTTLVNSVCFLTLVHRNYSNTPLTGLCIELRPPLDGSLSFSNGTTILQDCDIDPGTQRMELLQCSCNGVIEESPSIVLSYTVQCEYKEIVLKLPISIASFITGVPATVESVVKMYASLVEHQSSCKFARYKAKIVNRDMLAGFVGYQKSFTVVNLGEAAEIGGVGELQDYGPVVFFVKKVEEEYELRCRGPNVQLRDAVLRFLIGLISA